MMTAFVILYGLFFVLIGFLTKAYPNLIAGYNTMSKEKKEKVDIEGLSTFMRDALSGIGLATIVLWFVVKAWGLERLGEGVLLFVPIIGVIWILIRAQQYDHN
jgi:hypothetical protein